MKILIVEDEINTRDGLADLLGKISSEYIVCGKASDGEEGALLAKELKPDLIICDIEMPKLNGLEMIERIKENGENPLFVILSGYSDFIYAQKGIRLGVVEYLLKPITYSNLRNIMSEMSVKINTKQINYSTIEKDIPRDEILKEVLLNKGKISEFAYQTIEGNVKQEQGMFLINFYLSRKHRDKSEVLIKELTDFMNNYNIRSFYFSYIIEFDYITAFINAPLEFDRIIKMLKYNLIASLKRNGFTDISCSIVNLNDLGEIRSSLDKLKTLSKWHIVLKNEDIISFESIQKLKLKECIYPREIEAVALQSVKNNDIVKLIETNKKLILLLGNDLYDPFDLIEICSNYIFSILTFQTALEGSNNNLYNEFIDQGVLNHIKSCCSIVELQDCLDNFVKRFFKPKDEIHTKYSLHVRKTVNYIKEYYKDRVYLEEAAAKVNITPEYLSRLFTKEIGKSFSDYVKDYRIDKAKKLLMNDKAKIYEIAEKVGYSDPKYFCKIFKEVTGVSPKEYMKLY